MAEQDSTQTIEAWKPIPGYEGIYSVSSLGRVRRDKPGPGTKPGKILRCRPQAGYLTFYLTKDGQTKGFRAHYLVMLAFTGPRPKGLSINHKNGVKTDNRPQNLEYVTQRYNCQHASAMGLLPKGATHPFVQHPEIVPRGEEASRAKLSDLKVTAIKHLLPVMSQGDIAVIFGVTDSAISAIKTGATWAHHK
jgi:hypothetical protein